MSAIDMVPGNKNFLSPLNFTFVLKRTPHLKFFVQEINIPGISLQPLETPTPTLRIPQTGLQPTFNDLQVTYKVDEDFENYSEVFNWLKRLSSIDSSSEYAILSDKGKETGEWIKSDISLIIGNSAKNPNFEVTFRDAFPIQISDLQFRYTDTQVDYVTSSTTFKYTSFSIRKL